MEMSLSTCQQEKEFLRGSCEGGREERGKLKQPPEHQTLSKGLSLDFDMVTSQMTPRDTRHEHKEITEENATESRHSLAFQSYKLLFINAHFLLAPKIC